MTSPRPAPAPFAAVVLAGGRANRLGGTDKASLEVAGRDLLGLALEAVADAAEVVVVGDPVPTARPVVFTREEPRYAGPAAALLAGRGALGQGCELVVVLACDMPRVTAATVRRLRDSAVGCDGAVLVGPDGRRQLALVLDIRRLDAAAPAAGEREGLAMHRLLAPLGLVEVAAIGAEHRDVDTWQDLRDLGEH